MHYQLAQPWTGGKDPLPISEGEFVTLREAKAGAIRVLAIEEKMDMVLHNFVEHESDFLKLALRSAVFQEYDWSEVRDQTQLVNRRLLNLLSACRLYVDQVPQDLAALRDPALRKAFGAAKLHEKRARFGFLFMEAIRNYIQHRDVPFEA